MADPWIADAGDSSPSFDLISLLVGLAAASADKPGPRGCAGIASAMAGMVAVADMPGDGSQQPAPGPATPASPDPA